MNNKIIFYKYNGDFAREEELTEDNLAHTNGLKIKCHLKDGSERVGYSDPYRLHDNNPFMEIEEYIYLVTWINLDEKTHDLIGDEKSMFDKTYTRVNIDDIIYVEAILFSNPKWGGPLTNLFSFGK